MQPDTVFALKHRRSYDCISHETVSLPHNQMSARTFKGIVCLLDKNEKFCLFLDSFVRTKTMGIYTSGSTYGKAAMWLGREKKKKMPAWVTRHSTPAQK